MIGAGGSFSKLHLEDLELETLQDHPEFQEDFNRLIQTLEVANPARCGFGAIIHLRVARRIFRSETDLAHALANPAAASSPTLIWRSW